MPAAAPRCAAIKYQSVGPQFPDGNPTGGTAISAGDGGIPPAHPGQLRLRAFVDAGQVSANGVPFAGNYARRRRDGRRYYTSIGPIRLDVAVPVDRLPNGGVGALYRDRAGVLMRRLIRAVVAVIAVVAVLVVVVAHSPLILDWVLAHATSTVRTKGLEIHWAAG